MRRIIDQWESVRLGREEHGFIAGMTGSGKSMLARFLVNDPHKAYSVVYDPKHSRTIGEWPYQEVIYDFEELESAEERRIVYRPSLIEAEDKRSQEKFFSWIYSQGHVRCYVDECSALLGEAKPNFWLRGCLTRGRELGVSMLCATQRPVSIPLITMSEATRLYVFRLGLEEDRRRIAKLTDISDEEQLALRHHEFYYFDIYNGRSSNPFTLDLNGII